jgi:hypothetical protein
VRSPFQAISGLLEPSRDVGVELGREPPFLRGIRSRGGPSLEERIDRLVALLSGLVENGLDLARKRSSGLEQLRFVAARRIRRIVDQQDDSTRGILL